MDWVGMLKYIAAAISGLLTTISLVILTDYGVVGKIIDNSTSPAKEKGGE